LPGDFPEQPDTEKIQAYFPDDARVEKRISSVQNYLDSLSQIFPEFKKPSLKTEAISDPDWGEQWKKYFNSIRFN